MTPIFRNFVVGFLCVISVAASAAEPIVLKFSHVTAVDTPKGKAAVYFANKVAELTKGRVRIDIFANSTLYSDSDEMAALQQGAVQILAPSLAKFASLGIREFEVFDMPFIFEDTKAFHKVTEGPVGAVLLAKLEPKGIKGLAFWDNGFKSFSANKPLRTIEDFRGLKMRIQPSIVLEAQVRALGCLPQVLALSNVQDSLKRGTVDGTENPISNFYTQKMHEVQAHLAITNHGYLGYAIIVDKKFWDALPADIRAQLEQAVKAATSFANKIAEDENDRALVLVKQSGKTTVYEWTKAERANLKQIMMPVHKNMAPRVGPELLQSIYKATGFNPDKNPTDKKQVASK